MKNIEQRHIYANISKTYPSFYNKTTASKSYQQAKYFSQNKNIGRPIHYGENEQFVLKILEEPVCTSSFAINRRELHANGVSRKHRS